MNKGVLIGTAIGFGMVTVGYWAGRFVAENFSHETVLLILALWAGGLCYAGVVVFSGGEK